MMKYDEFHDGFFEGLWIDAETAHVFLANSSRVRSVLVADGVVQLDLNGVRSGNIIFDVVISETEEITLQDIRVLYDLRDGSEGETQGTNLLEKARLEGAKILAISPSYGAELLILAKSFALFPRQDWQNKY
jgi:hypothetical protein